MVQQHGDDLLGPEVLDSPAELGQKRKFRTVCVDSVGHDVLAVCLYVRISLQQEDGDD
jgi:hypothetical protein